MARVIRLFNDYSFYIEYYRGPRFSVIQGDLRKTRECFYSWQLTRLHGDTLKGQKVYRLKNRREIYDALYKVVGRRQCAHSGEKVAGGLHHRQYTNVCEIVKLDETSYSSLRSGLPERFSCQARDVWVYLTAYTISLLGQYNVHFHSWNGLKCSICHIQTSVCTVYIYKNDDLNYYKFIKICYLGL